MAMSPFRERQTLRWQEVERKRISLKLATSSGPLRFSKKFWQYGASVWNGAVAAVLSLTAAASVILIFAVFINSLVEQTISVQPLSVPKSIAEAGFTADVAALQLRDAINSLAAQAKTSMPRRQVMQQAEIIDAVVPTVGLSVQTISAEIRAFLGIKRRETISGEFILESGSLRLTLRLDGKPLFASANSADSDRPVSLLNEAAHAVMRATQPYIFAVLADARSVSG